VSRLVVLGSCGAWPEPGRASSGFVLEHEGFRIVIDLGYATLPRLLTVIGSPVAERLDAVIITHRHADHSIDLHGLFRSRWLPFRGRLPQLPLYSPPGVLDQVLAFEEDRDDAVEQVFRWHPLPADPYEVGPFRLASWALPHFVPNAGVRLSSTGLTIAYTGDTGPDPALVELGRDADLFIMDSSDPSQQESGPPQSDPERMLLSAAEAGSAAQAAGARRLLLTHFLPGNDREQSRSAAAEVFAGEILLADEGLEIALP
jgi:ribonuclease BN (tRNA processing enzyme)